MNKNDTRNRKDSAGDVVCANKSPAEEDKKGEDGAEATSKLREQLEAVKQELNTTRSQSKSRIAELEHRLKMAESERSDMRGEMESVRERADRLQASCEQYADERTTQTHVVARLESELRTVSYATGGSSL